MSNRVRLEKEGLLSEKRRELMGVFNRAKALQEELHSATIPYLPVHEIEVDRLLTKAKDLRKYVREIRILTNEVRDLQEELGIGDE